MTDGERVLPFTKRYSADLWKTNNFEIAVDEVRLLNIGKIKRIKYDELVVGLFLINELQTKSIGVFLFADYKLLTNAVDLHSLVSYS